MHENLVTANMVLYCKEWNATVRFYRDGLRLPVVFSTDWFVELSLTATSRLSIADEKRSSIKSCGNAGLTVSLQVKDIDAAWEYAEKMGLKPTVVERHPWNARIFYLFDPEGHRVEIWQPLVSDELPNPGIAAFQGKVDR